MQSKGKKFRAIVHLANIKLLESVPVALYGQNLDIVNAALNKAVESGFATGGRLEEDIPGIGWSYFNPENITDEDIEMLKELES